MGGMMKDITEGDRYSGTKLYVSIIAVTLSVLMFILGRESLHSNVQANTSINTLQHEQIRHVVDDVAELKTEIKAYVVKIEASIKDQGTKVDELHSFLNSSSRQSGARSR